MSFQIGEKVVIHDLVRSHCFNNLCGVVFREAPNNRIGVRLPNGKELSLKPKNLSTVQSLIHNSSVLISQYISEYDFIKFAPLFDSLAKKLKHADKRSYLRICHYRLLASGKKHYHNLEAMESIFNEFCDVDVSDDRKAASHYF